MGASCRPCRGRSWRCRSSGSIAAHEPGGRHCCADRSISQRHARAAAAVAAAASSAAAAATIVDALPHHQGLSCTCLEMEWCAIVRSTRCMSRMLQPMPDLSFVKRGTCTLLHAAGRDGTPNAVCRRRAMKSQPCAVAASQQHFTSDRPATGDHRPAAEPRSSADDPGGSSTLICCSSEPVSGRVAAAAMPAPGQLRPSLSRWLRDRGACEFCCGHADCRHIVL